MSVLCSKPSSHLAKKLKSVEWTLRPYVIWCQADLDSYHRSLFLCSSPSVPAVSEHVGCSLSSPGCPHNSLPRLFQVFTQCVSGRPSQTALVFVILTPQHTSLLSLFGLYHDLTVCIFTCIFCWLSVSSH